ncbi:apolipoprotein N-acyltransferase [Desulfonatronovibrio hydrogenovorans]|uniref:apolipoprotein N-acyltransferase n=1 Tax=Desulfonatronovibrio hydrogenovorans TaxID=53245 RepID=UPI001377D56F|nr:apolipoprotein N-acyltransferase [Desulfonatronovibrio hydrogenovorans]
MGLYFGFANPIYHFPPFFFLFLLGLNRIALDSDSAGQVFVRSWLATGLAFSVCLYWIVVPVHQFGGFPLVLALFCPVLLGFCIALFSSAYALFVSTVKKSSSWLLLGVFSGCAWSGLEFIREYALTGFPWFLAAQSFAVWPESIQAVSIIGSYGLGMILAACGMWFSLGKVKSSLLGAGVLAVVLGYGYLIPGKVLETGQARFLAVQGNIDQTLKWEEKIQRMTIDKYFNLTLDGSSRYSPDLVIWPETALPFYFQEATELSHMVRNFAQENQLNILTGSPAYRMDPDGVGYSLYNRAFWIDADGFVHDYYDKEHLVPFGEYVPLGRFIPFLDSLVEGELDFSPGTQKTPLTRDDLALGVLICYEIIFPNLARQRVAKGSNILINLSNDAWFGSTSAPEQHLHLGVLRAVEQGRYVIRATNTGISAFIDPGGRVYKRTGLFEDAYISAQAGLVDSKTLYHRLYWFINILLLMGVFVSLFIHYHNVRSSQK